jgi:hypothetical protein
MSAQIYRIYDRKANRVMEVVPKRGLHHFFQTMYYSAIALTWTHFFIAGVYYITQTIVLILPKVEHQYAAIKEFFS